MPSTTPQEKNYAYYSNKFNPGIPLKRQHFAGVIRIDTLRQRKNSPATRQNRLPPLRSSS
jgi:hypothetical protein